MPSGAMAASQSNGCFKFSESSLQVQDSGSHWALLGENRGLFGLGVSLGQHLPSQGALLGPAESDLDLAIQNLLARICCLLLLLDDCH